MESSLIFISYSYVLKKVKGIKLNERGLLILCMAIL